MEHNTESISESLFTHFPSSNTISHTRSDSCGNQTNLIINNVKKRILAHRNQLQSGAATLGIGASLLITVYLFLTQLAEYGWQ